MHRTTCLCCGCCALNGGSMEVAGHQVDDRRLAILSDCMSLPLKRRLTLDAMAEPHARRVSHERS
jgi:hypothetical protein